MSTEILTLAQWLSPAYPVGAFAYSHGIEAAVASGLIADGDDLRGWLGDLLSHGSGRTDCVLLHLARACGTQTDLATINAAGLAFAASAERRLEAQAQGAAFCTTTGAIWGGDESFIYPVAVGAAAARLKLNGTLAAAMFLQAMVSNLVAAAQRCMPLGQTEGQAIVAALSPLCHGIAEDTKDATLDDLHSTAFLSDIASMQHETLAPRIFRT